ncbi:MAG: hypothetical protein IIC23_12535 [Chloroflexi bacterium]|nr:hypothetical protein [Chloroflexota bacterium]
MAVGAYSHLLGCISAPADTRAVGAFAYRHAAGGSIANAGMDANRRGLPDGCCDCYGHPGSAAAPNPYANACS